MSVQGVLKFNWQFESFNKFRDLNNLQKLQKRPTQGQKETKFWKKKLEFYQFYFSLSHWPVFVLNLGVKYKHVLAAFVYLFITQLANSRYGSYLHFFYRHIYIIYIIFILYIHYIYFSLLITGIMHDIG